MDNQGLARIYADAVLDAQVPTQAAEVSPPEPLSAEPVAVRKMRREQWERYSVRANSPNSGKAPPSDLQKSPVPPRGAPAVLLREAFPRSATANDMPVPWCTRAPN